MPGRHSDDQVHKVKKTAVPSFDVLPLSYYIEMKFKTTHAETQYHVTTPGYIWPPTLPFPACHGEGCIGPLV